jgi:isoleucyl-tRNA synthetase
MSPVAPFFSEWLHQKLNRVTGRDEASVHLAYFPTVEETAIDPLLERRMKLARDISSMVLRSRNKVNLNVRQPLSRIIIPAGKKDQKDILAFESIILDEVNIKAIEFVTDDSKIVHKTAKPVFPVLGKKAGRDMKEIAAIISTMDAKSIHSFEALQSAAITLSDGRSFRLEAEDVEIVRTGLEGWSVESEDGLTIAIDTELTDGLIREGYAREFVNRIQNMRKESAYEVTDSIVIGFVTADERLAADVLAMRDYICEETLARTLEQGILSESDFTKEWEIDGSACTISMHRQT